MKNYLFITLLIPFIGVSQIFCGYDHAINTKKNNQSFINNYNNLYDYANSRLASNLQTYHIPVVFHIV